MTEELKIKITAELKNLKDNVKEGSKSIKDFVEKNKEQIKEFNEELQKVGDVSKKGLGIAAGAAAAGATALLALGSATKEQRENQAKLNNAFENAGSTASVAKGVYKDLFRVLGEDDVSVEAANHLAKLTTNQKDLSEWTNICQGIFATFGDSLPIEGLTEAANETAKVGKVTGTLADALNWAGVNEDSFNDKLAACNTEAEREKLIRETLTGLYSDAASLYEENAAGVLSQNEAQMKLNENMAKIGEMMAPINAMLSEFGTEILSAILPMLNEFIQKYAPKIKDALTELATKIGNVLTWLIDNWDLVSTIGAIVLGVAAALAVFSTAMTVVNFVMAASPVTWIVLGIVAALTALVAIIVIVIKNWDNIKKATSNAMDTMKNKIDGAIEKIKNKFDDFLTKIRNIVNTIKGLFNFEFRLPRLKVPSFNITPRGWSVGDLLKGSIPKLSVNWNAVGGVFDKPTIVPYGNSLQGLGENGAEAIVPLENNTEWLDKIADKLASKQASTPIVLNVDGKTFAQTSINSINQLTKQTGKLGLKLQ